MNWFSGRIHNPRQITLRGTDTDFACKQISCVETTDWIQSQIARLVDMTHQEPDLIHMRRHHHFDRFAGDVAVLRTRPANTDEGSHRIDGDFVAQLLLRHIVLNHLANPIFTPGNRRCLRQCLEQLHA